MAHQLAAVEVLGEPRQVVAGVVAVGEGRAIGVDLEGQVLVGVIVGAGDAPEWVRDCVTALRRPRASSA